MSTAQGKMAKEVEEQIFTSAINPNHAYRKLNRLIDFDAIATPLARLYSPLGQPGIPAVCGLNSRSQLFWQHLFLY